MGQKFLCLYGQQFQASKAFLQRTMVGIWLETHLLERNLATEAPAAVWAWLKGQIVMVIIPIVKEEQLRLINTDKE